jgi:hypothetical protein
MHLRGCVNIPIIPIGYSRLSKYILPLTDYSNPDLTSSPIDPHKLDQFLITISIDQQGQLVFIVVG